jgi:uncharacterized protein involved in high-affinity Fe2+ transport
MKTLLLVMLILTACGGDDKKETPATQSDMTATTDATLIDMIITDMVLSNIDMDKEGDMVIESDMATVIESDMASTPASDMVIPDMSVSTDMVIDMAVSSDMASK